MSRLGGKHQQLARQVGDSASSSANLMAGSNDANNVPEGTTRNSVPGLVRPMDRAASLVTSSRPKRLNCTNNRPAKISNTVELSGDQALLGLNSNITENVSTPTRTHESAESDTNSGPKNFQFLKPSENLWIISSQLNALRSLTQNYSME